MPGSTGMAPPQSVGNNIDPVTGRPYAFGIGAGLNGWRYGDDGSWANGDQAQNGLFNGAFSYSPEFMRSLGFDGPGRMQTSGQGGDGYEGDNPAFLQFLQDRGLRIASSTDGPESDMWMRGRAFDAQGNAVGDETRWRGDLNEDAFFAMMMAGGLFGGAAAAGVGAAGAGAGEAAAGGGSAGGISAQQAAYGALENGAAYGGGAGSSLTASAAPGFGGALGEGGLTAAGGEFGGMTAAEASAAGGVGAEGGAGLTFSNPAGLANAAAGGGSGGSFGGGLFGGSGATATGFGGTGFSAGELLGGAGAASGLAGMGSAGYGSNNSLGGFDYSGAGSGGSSIADTLRQYLTNPNGGGLSGLGQGLLGLGVGAATGGRGDTGMLNNVNYQQAATAQGQSGRTNQTNAQGSLTYNQNGVDAQGNPTYSQNVALNAPYQRNLDQALGNQSTALGNLQNYNSGLPSAYSNVPGLYGNAGSQEGMVRQAQDAIYNRQATYLDPQYQQRQDQLGQQLANQGVTYGSDAYNNAMRQFSSDRDNAYSSLRNDAITQGNSYANQLFNQNLQAHNTGMSDISAQGSNYMGQANGAMNGVTQNPTFAQTPQQTNYLGAAQLQGNANLNQYNANIGNTNNLTNGLTNIAGSLAGNQNFWSGLGNLFGGSGN